VKRLRTPLYILPILLLSLLAVKPYWPKLKSELLLFHATWQTLRGAPSTSPAAEGTENPENTPIRKRKITPPIPPATLQLAEGGTDPSERVDPFLAEARERARSDPAAAMQWLQEQSSGGERLRGMLEVVALWAAEDAESALLWLESNAQGLARLETINSGVELWARRDPEATAGWIDGMANDGSKIAAARSLATTWVETDSMAAANWVDGLPRGAVRQAALQSLTKAWLQQDPDAASIWAFEQAEVHDDHDLLHETIKAYSQKSPDAAEALVRDMFAAGKDQTALFSHVLGRAERDPKATAEWLANLSPDDPIYSSQFASGLMSVWAESDSIAASEWLSQMPVGAQRDAAVWGFSESIQRFEPEAAAAWANAIGDPKRRAERLQATLREWSTTRPDEAFEWVKNADLEPALREQLAREIPWD